MTIIVDEGLRNLLVVMPMAGRAQRFKDVGIHTPKPLIDVVGKPMILRALASVPALETLPPQQIVAVVRQSDVDQHGIIGHLRNRLGPVQVKIDPAPAGAAGTVLVARDMIPRDSPVLVMDCDICFESLEFEGLLCRPPDWLDGMIPVFGADGKRWSFSAVGGDGRIVQIIEKQRLDVAGCKLLANVGFYWFARGCDLIAACQSALAACPAGQECYMSQAVGWLIERGRHFHATMCTHVFDMGTPVSHAEAEAEFSRRQTGGQHEQ